MKKYLILFTNLLFATLLADLNAQVLNESFDNSTLPTNWSVVANSGNPNDLWATGQRSSAGSTAFFAEDHTGNSGYFLWTDFNDIVVGDSSFLYSPTVSVATLTSPYVYFWLYSHYSGASNVNPYNTLNVAAWDGANWNSIGTVQEDNGGWTLYAFDIAGNTFNTDSVKLRFTATTTNTSSLKSLNDLLIDDISIDEMQTCA